MGKTLKNEEMLMLLTDVTRGNHCWYYIRK